MASRKKYTYIIVDTEDDWSLHCETFDEMQKELGLRIEQLKHESGADAHEIIETLEVYEVNRKVKISYQPEKIILR